MSRERSCYIERPKAPLCKRKNITNFYSLPANLKRMSCSVKTLQNDLDKFFRKIENKNPVKKL